MCGVIAAFVKNASINGVEDVKKLLIESKIRGLHATGISYVTRNTLFTVKGPMPADEFIKGYNFNGLINEADNSVYMIGHTRYSTSDLEWNQPIERENVALVHNGVVTQDSPDHWKYPTEGKNDSELLLASREHGKAPMADWPDASVAGCILENTKDGPVLNVFRNGKRPLYYVHYDNAVFVASTVDILHRCGMENAVEVQAGHEIGFDSNLNIMYNSLIVETTDLQACNS